MRILVLGGTVFVGRAFVAAALDTGHEVTIFHRGVRGRDVFPEVEHVLGDRDGGLNFLTGRAWDVVVDCCGYVPRIVRQSAQMFSGIAETYVFVSTISVYADGLTPQQDESAPVGMLDDDSVETIDGTTYGPLKALCEQEVLAAFGDRAFIVRPGLIMGPNDPTNRFPYWVEQFGSRDWVLAPNRPEQPMQLIDARDLAAFMLQGISSCRGIYNVVGLETPRTFGDLIEACRTLRPSAEVFWADEAELDKRGLALWTDLPLVLPFSGDTDGMEQIDVSKAIGAGLRFRPWAETVLDTWNWLKTLPADRPRPHGSKSVDA